MTSVIIEPRFEHLFADGDVIWVEYKNPPKLFPLVKWHGMYANYDTYLEPTEITDAADYGENYRCWVNKPSDNLRVNTPWKNLSEN